MQTAPILPKIIKESVYVNSSIDLEDNNFVYHYFYSPISVNGNNAISMITIKEIVTDKSKNPKFYYHDIREINNEELLHAIPQQELSKMLFEETPSIDNSIPQKPKTVKNDTAINKQSMQKSENNTNSPDKNINSVESIEQKAIEKELHNRIQNAILSKNSRKNTILGNVSQKVVNKVQKLLGIDISGRVHLLADNDIRHMIKEHGNPAIEKAKGQVAITTRDIEMIPDIINNYDNLIQGSDNKQGKTIRYIKNYPNNRTYVVEVIPNANQKSLYIKTMWKKPSNTKIKEPVTLTNSQTTPSSTSKTRGNSGSNTSITQNMENVKDDSVRSMKKSNSSSLKTKKNNTLIAQHNTSEEKILEALELGALPVPSIAITKYQNPVSNYGDITLLFNKDTINPTDKRNVTYNSDIYSTRKPQTANMLIDKRSNHLKKLLQTMEFLIVI